MCLALLKAQEDTAWLQDKFDPMGAMVIQVLSAVIVSLGVMFWFCTCTVSNLCQGNDIGLDWGSDAWRPDPDATLK